MSEPRDAFALDGLRALLGAPDPRTPEELESDLADELGFHLDALEREEREAGLDADAARAAARRRFGDPDTIRAACRRVAMEERVMLQRFNAILIVFLLLAVAALGVHAVLSQQRNARTLEELHATMAMLASERERAEAEAGAGFVYLEGDVDRPGAYDLPVAGKLTVRRLVVAAGGVGDAEAHRVIVRRGDRQAYAEDWKDDPLAAVEDFTLSPGDLVTVKRIGAAPVADAAEVGESKATIYLAGSLWQTTETIHPLPAGRTQVLRRIRLGVGMRGAEELELTVDRPDTGSGASGRIWSGRWWTGDTEDPEGLPELRDGDILELSRPPGTTVEVFLTSALHRNRPAAFPSQYYRSPEPATLAELVDAWSLLRLPPSLDRASIRVHAEIRIPRADGASEVHEASWLRTRETVPELAIPRGSHVVVAFEALEPLPHLDLGEMNGLNLEQRLVVLSILERALAHGHLDESEQAELAATRDRVLGWLQGVVDPNPPIGADPEPAAHPTTASPAPIPPPLELEALSSLDRVALQTHLSALAAARQRRDLDDATRERLRREFAALLEEMRRR